VSADPPLHPPDCAPAVRPNGVAKAFAVLAPALLLLGPLAWWARPDPPAALSPAAAGMERELAKNPDIVLLGASKVYTDLDQEAIARAFAPSPDKLVPLNLSGTTAPVWYAILKNRVFGTGQKPKLILVYSTFDWTLAAAPSGEAERAVLLAQMGAEEDVLRRKALGEGTGGAGMERVRRRRTEAHGALMAFVRNAAVGVTLAERGPDGTIAAGAALAAPALDNLFGMQAGLDLTAARGAIPIVEAEREGAHTSSSLDDTLLPDFLDLAKQNGAKIVFIHAPVRLAAEVGYQVDPALLRDAVQAINDAGAGYIDLRDLRLGDAAFGDAAHLNKVGRDALTKALLARLEAIGAAGEGPIAPAALPVVTRPPTVTRVGAPPALPAVEPKRGPKACGWEAPVPDLRPLNDFSLQAAGLGMVSPLLLLEDGVPLKPHAGRDEFDEACKGAFLHQERAVKFSPTGSDPEIVPTRTYTFGLSPDAPLRTAQGFEAWWVYPGTSLKLAFDEAPAAGGAFGLVVDTVVFGKGAGAATVRVDDGPETPLVGAGLHRSAALTPPAPTGPWSLTVSSPADGGWVLLRRVVHGSEDALVYVVGAPGPSAVGVLAADAAYTPAPAALPALGAATPGEGALSTFDIAAAGVPNTQTLWDLASVAGCSPVRISEDGTALPHPVVRVQDVVKGGAGRYTQVGTTLTVTGSDGTAPHANGRAYTAALDPTRRCRGLRWLYPGDTATITVKPELLASLNADATRLEIGGAAVATDATTAEATLRVRVGDTVYLDTRFPLAGLATAPPAWTFDPPLPRGPAPLVIELSTPADAPYTLVTSLALTETGGVPFAGPAAAEAAP